MNQKANFNYEIIKAENLTTKYSHVIIPGVGNYSNAMQGLRENEGDKKIKQLKTINILLLVFVNTSNKKGHKKRTDKFIILKVFDIFSPNQKLLYHLEVDKLKL